MQYVTREIIRKTLPEHKPDSHKGDHGRLLVIGGSRTLYGAPALAALAALRTGCDLVKIAAPEASARIYSSMSPNLIVEPLTGHNLTSSHTRKLLDLSERAHAVLIGPGLGTARETRSFVTTFLSRLQKPCVIDADATKALTNSKDILGPNHILTPHFHEFSLLSGHDPTNNTQERASQTRTLAKTMGCTILLKGHVDVISNGKETLLNKTGSPFMTKGGTGDTLAGICGALLAMGNPPFDTACAAAHINGLAGEAAAKQFGPGLLATDLLEAIPKIIRNP